jgi:hypothetical protein
MGISGLRRAVDAYTSGRRLAYSGSCSVRRKRRTLRWLVGF